MSRTWWLDIHAVGSKLWRGLLGETLFLISISKLNLPLSTEFTFK